MLTSTHVPVLRLAQPQRSARQQKYRRPFHSRRFAHNMDRSDRANEEVRPLPAATATSGAIPRLLILIPAFNEAGAIRHVVQSVRQVVPRADIVVIDDGSKDNTRHEAAQAGAFVVRHPFNLGIGGTVQTGLKFARQHGYDYVIRLDGDGQHNPQEIPLLLQALLEQRADAVFGSRFLGSKMTMQIPLARRLRITLFAWTVSFVTGQKATDTTSGFLGLNRAAITTLARFMPQDYPEVEGRIILHKAGLTTLELPTHMRMRMAGVSSIDKWRSIYYACKVTVAALICALKEIPVIPKEIRHGDTTRPTSYRHYLQPGFGAGDSPADP